MNIQEFEEILALGHEQRGVEFKRGGSRKSDKQLLVKVIRAAIGMANRRDGGYVIIGVDEENNGTPLPSGITDDDLATWNYDDFADSLAEYTDPNISFELELFEWQGKKFLIVNVHEFEDVPILCKRDYPQILRAGACYVRTRRKPETLEIPTQTDMRDLLDLAIEKGVRKFVAQAQTAGLTFSGTVQDSDTQLFNKQIDDLLGDTK